MKPSKILVILILLILAPVTSYAKINAVVTIVPQVTFLEKIGGDLVNIEVMVTPGADPHTYEPKPSQMKAISEADLYFAMGIEFEHAWLPKFNAQNQSMRIVFTQRGVDFIELEERIYHGDHYHEGVDNHIWTSPRLVKIMTRNMAKALMRKDKKNKAIYAANLKKFHAEIDQLDARLREIFTPLPENTKFMIFHPAFEYFARDYGLKQIAIEYEGKEPKPQMLVNMVKEAKKEGIKTIITSPEFSDKSARTIAKEIGGSVVKLSPLAKNWSENLIRLAEMIAKDNQKQ